LDTTAITEALSQRIGAQKYKIWFQSCARFTVAEGTLRIGVANPFLATWLEGHFLKDIQAAAQTVLGSVPEIVFTVDAQLGGPQRRAVTGSGAPTSGSAAGGRERQSPDWQKQPIGIGLPNAEVCVWGPRSAVPGRPGSGLTVEGTSPAGAEGLRLTLDTFVVGSSNELAYNAAKAVIREQQSPFNPLFIHGGYGVGKTHLLRGICHGVAQARPQTR
jgi:chromosomal replication initiator protein